MVRLSKLEKRILDLCSEGSSSIGEIVAIGSAAIQPLLNLLSARILEFGESKSYQPGSGEVTIYSEGKINPKERTIITAWTALRLNAILGTPDQILGIIALSKYYHKIWYTEDGNPILSALKNVADSAEVKANLVQFVNYIISLHDKHYNVKVEIIKKIGEPAIDHLIGCVATGSRSDFIMSVLEEPNIFDETKLMEKLICKNLDYNYVGGWPDIYQLIREREWSAENSVVISLIIDVSRVLDLDIQDVRAAITQILKIVSKTKDEALIASARKELAEKYKTYIDKKGEMLRKTKLKFDAGQFKAPRKDSLVFREFKRTVGCK